MSLYQDGSSSISRGIYKDMDDFGGVKLIEEWFKCKTLFNSSHGFGCGSIPYCVTQVKLTQ